MGWSLGFDTNWNRDIGYGVPAICDHPKCDKEIDRGLGYVCGGDIYGGEKGCGLFFCGHHLSAGGQLCPKCDRYDKKPYKAKPDARVWERFKLKHSSWKSWRDENPELVLQMRERCYPSTKASP